MDAVPPENSWLNDVFFPALESTKARNVYFISGGAHYSHITKFKKGRYSYVGIQCTGAGSASDGNNNLGTKNGVTDDTLAYQPGRGYIEVTVSPCEDKVIVKLFSTDLQPTSPTVREFNII